MEVESLADRPPGRSVPAPPIQLVGEGLDPPSPTDVQPHRQRKCHSEWSVEDAKSKNLRSIDSAKILRLVSLAQDDGGFRILQMEVERLADRPEAGPYGFWKLGESGDKICP